LNGANKIKAGEVPGVIHQTRQVKMIGSGRSDIKAPMVTVSILYADEIKAADSVVANDAYVRDLDPD